MPSFSEHHTEGKNMITLETTEGGFKLSIKDYKKM
jgi:hypothetical protein